MVLLPSAWLTKETWPRSHQSKGWYTTGRHASWKRRLTIRNSSLAPVFQMTPSNFPFPSSELLPGNLPCPLLWLGRSNEYFTERAGLSSPPFSFSCTHELWLTEEHCWRLKWGHLFSQAVTHCVGWEHMRSRVKIKPPGPNVYWWQPDFTMETTICSRILCNVFSAQWIFGCFCDILSGFHFH